MRYWFAVLIVCFATAAHANVPCSVPFNLTNGSTADASQVMANYNAILACLANDAAASGVNSDITALTGLTTPIPPSGGGTLSYSGSAVSGSNAIVVGTTLPGDFVLNAVGQKVSFVATASNTGATTLTVGSTATKNLYRETPSGPQPMVGGEIVTGQLVEATWDGTEYQQTSQPALGHAPGEAFDYTGAACPVGSLEATGNPAVSQAAFPTLFATIGTIWGASGGGNFTIPDLRGRATFSRDVGGTTRITAAGGNFDGSVIGHVGGQQSLDIAQNQLPNIVPTFTGIQQVLNATNGAAFITAGAGNISNGAGFGQSSSLTITPAGTISSINGNVTQILTPVLSNAAIVLKCIKG